MGYSEVRCRLCGVTFNIGRRRLRTERAWMGWRCTGDTKEVGCQLGKGREPDICMYEEDEDGDCTEVCLDEEGTGDVVDTEAKMDVHGDEEYVFEESDREEVLEFQSEGDDNLDDSENDDAMNIDVGPEDDAYILFKDNITQDPPPPHNCFPGSGYKGTFITAEEMLGCNTAQCLLSKAHHEHGTRDEQDDQDFERGGRYCLSGLCDHVRSRDCGGETILPARHGVSAPIIDSIVLEAGDNYTAIPFHPTCFDIFSRLSRQRFGYVNFEALGQWCFAESSSCAAVNRVSSDENVRANIEQWWQHIEGTEYLAANPLFIPRLTPILRNAIQHDPNFSPMNGAFNVPDHHGEADIFTKLPLELRLQILSYLPSQTIANLRLSSRTFRQLPILLWRDLLLTEMPWLWEVWSDDVPYIWATTTYTAVVEHEQTGKELQDWLEKSRAVIKEEMPDIFNEWDTDVRKVLSKRVGYLEAGRAEALRTMVTGLPVAKTNWYRLYTDIVRNWGDLKGLWNRERIWRDVGEIVRKLDKYT